MAIIVPITSTFDPKGVTSAERAFQKLGNQAGSLSKTVSTSSSIMKTALVGLGAASVVHGLQSAVMAASTLSESVSKANVVFGKNATAVQNWSQTTAKAIGISRQASLEAAATYGNLFRAFGLTEQQSYSMSTSLVQLAADMASFNNTSVDDALLALRSGLSGETEPLKKYGIALTDVRLKEQAMSMGLIKTTSGVLPQAIKTQAAYALIMKDSALAQGDISRTAGGLANQLRFLQAGLEDAKAGFGEALLPAALSVVNTFNQQLLPAITNVTTAFSQQGFSGGLRSAATEVSNFIFNLTGLAKVISQVVFAMAGIKASMLIFKVAPPLIAGVTSALQTMRIAALYGADGFKVLAVSIKGALASTGIGLLVLGLGLVVGKLIEARVAAEATDKTVTIMESHGVQTFNRWQKSIGGVIVSLNAASLAATQLDDITANAGIMDVKRKRTGYMPVAVPKTDAVATGVGKVSKEVATLSAAGKLAQESMAKLGDQLNKNNDALAKAKEAYQSFKDGITSVITGIIDFGSAATAETGTFLENLVKQAGKAADFGSKVQQLLSMGLSQSAISQVLAAGADAGSKIADEIISGGASVVDQVNIIVSATQSLADQVGESGAKQFYQVGIDTGQALVDGIKSAIAAAGFSINAEGAVVNQGAIDLVNSTLAKYQKSGKGLTKKEKKKISDLATQLGVDVPAMATGGIVTKPTLALIGESGPEAVIPLNGNNAPTGATINLTVNAGMGADGTQIGREIVDMIKRYERVSGPVFKSA